MEFIIHSNFVKNWHQENDIFQHLVKFKIQNDGKKEILPVPNI